MAQSIWLEGQTPWSNVPNVNYAYQTVSAPAGYASQPVYAPGGSGGAVQGASTITPTGSNVQTTYSPPAYNPPAPTGVTSPEDYQAQLQEAYSPLYAELDRQLEALSSQREAGESLVYGEYATRGKELETTKAAQERNLAYAESQQKETTEMTLQDLSQNAMDWLSAAQNVWGGSSAVPAVMTGMGKQISKARGAAFKTRAQNLKEISMKKVDLEELYSVQAQKLGDWKTQQLQNVMDQYLARESQIRQEKATAQAQHRAEAVTYAYQALKEIENRVLNYQAEMDSWREKKATEFDYMLRELEARAQYKTPSSPNLQLKIGPSGETYLFNPQTGELSYAGAGSNNLGISAQSGQQYGTQTTSWTKTGSQGQQLVWDADWNDYIDSVTGLPEGY